MVAALQPGPAPPPFSQLSVEPRNALVAELVGGGTIAGYVHLGPTDALESAAHVLEIKGLALDPRHQGRGIGRLLLEERFRLDDAYVDDVIMALDLTSRPLSRSPARTSGR